jgi:outer membrane protein assembly factor BamB
VFSAVVVFLLAANALRARAVDPLDTARIDDMSLSLNRNPQDAQLRDRLRALDVRVRDGFQKSRAFAITGFYLLLGGIAVYLVAQQVLASTKKDPGLPNPEALQRAWRPGPQSLRSVTSLGFLLAGFLGTASVLSRHDAEAEYARAVARGPSASAASRQAAGQAGSDTPGIQPITPGGVPGIAGPIGPQSPTGGSLSAGTVLVPINPVSPGNRLGSKPGGAGTHQAGPEITALYPEPWAAAWPGFRGPGGVGVATTKDAPETWSPSQGVLWKTPIPLPGWNSPVVWGDKVFLTGADKTSRKVYCLDAGSGAIVWAKEVPSSTKELPQIQEDTGYAPSTVATDGRHVCAIFPNGDLVCFDFTGKQVWRHDLGMPANNYGHASSPVVYGDGLLVQLDQGTSGDDGKSLLLALSVDTGKTVWQVKRPVGGSWTTPILVKAGGRAELITAANPMAIAYDPTNGTELWRAQCLNGDCACSPTFGGGFVFTANMGATLSAIRPDMSGDITKTGIAWTSMDDLPDIVSLLSADGLLYMVTTEGVVTCLDAKTGKKQWAQNYNTHFHASPVFASGRVYITEDDGKTHVLASGPSFKELATAGIGEDVRATPAFVGNRVYIRGKASMFCVGAK